MCLGILALDARFSQVKPRRPKGGPDGGRDIEATLDQGQAVWGAVGFRANATDSDEDKRWVQSKFKQDLDAATKENPSLAGFVFFTNVDLTPAEIRMLEEYARAKGVVFVDTLWRERLRISLDSPRGLALRYQHLGIPLSEAEQAAFFAEYGSRIEGLLYEGFGAIEDRLSRLEFLQDCSAPLLAGSVEVQLNRELTPQELGHFRFFVEILDMYEDDPHPGLWIAGRDSYPIYVSEANSQQLIGVRSLVWSRRPDERIQDTVFSDGSRTASYIEAGGHIHRRGPFATLGNLSRRNLSVYVTKPLLEHVAALYVCFNDYVVAGAQAEDFVPLDISPLAGWPDRLDESEQAVPWVALMLRIEDPPPWMPAELARTGWSLDFTRFTPQKMSGL